MLIKAIEVGYLQTNCYIVADEATLDAAVIDPGADSNLILDYIERCHFHVRAILLTHGHFDHCMGLEEVYDATGATVYMSHADLTTDIGNGMFGNEDFELDPPDDTVFVRERRRYRIRAGAFRQDRFDGRSRAGLQRHTHGAFRRSRH